MRPPDMAVPDTLVRADEWRERALCAGADPELWFPAALDRGATDPAHPALAPAIAVCHRCPVERDCLADAIATGDRWGIRGGMTPVQRARHARGLDQKESVNA